MSDLPVIPHLIAGDERTAEESYADVYNPALGRPVRRVPLASRATVAEAIAAAEKALPAWRQTGISKRAQVMFRMQNLLTERRDELAAVITEEHGKVLSDAAGEIARGTENIEFAAGALHHLKGEFLQQAATGVDVHQARQPVGVVACITPFNFPAMVPLWMISAALVSGNTVILKPSERDPSAAVWIARAFQEAGLPDGVLNVVHGDKVAVDALLEDPVVQAISFVGSTPIARSIYQTAANHGKRVQALGGAKNHMVVMPDADLDSAADAAVSAAYGSAGERCMAVSVVVAVGNVADSLVDKVSDRIADLRIGAGTDSDSEMGPLITAEARDRVSGYVASAEQDGAKVVVDGRAHKFDNDGFFIGVSLVDHVRPGMRVYDDEIFGPVLSVVRVESYEEAVELINRNRYANGVAVFTRDGRTAREFEMDIEVGMVGVNVPIPVPIGAFSFGGWKDSLFGDTHIYGPEAFDFYTRRKVVTSRWPQPSDSQVNLGFPTH